MLPPVSCLSTRLTSAGPILLTDDCGFGTISTFLSRLEWKSLPFTKIGKSQLQHVLDVLLEAPVIQTRFDKLPTLPPEENLPSVISIIKECVAVDRSKQDLYLDFGLAQGSPLYRLGSIIQIDEKEGELFSASYSFVNCSTATTIIIP